MEVLYGLSGIALGVLAFIVLFVLLALLGLKYNWWYICHERCTTCGFADTYPTGTICKNCRYNVYACIKDK